MAKQTACGTIVNWDSSSGDPADIPTASWAPFGIQSTATPPPEEWERVDMSELGVCRAEEQASGEAISDMEIVLYAEPGDTDYEAIRTAWKNKTKALFQIVYPWGDPNNPYQAFAGQIISITPNALERTGTVQSTVVITRQSDISSGTLDPGP